LLHAHYPSQRRPLRRAAGVQAWVIQGISSRGEGQRGSVLESIWWRCEYV
jgi:hypothetical protein